MENKKRLLVLFKLYLFLGNFNVLALEGEGIVGGEQSFDGDHPYLVSIQIRGIHLCSGSILNRNHIVTAAHCVCDVDGQSIGHLLRVVGGINDLNSTSSTKQTCDIEKIFVPKSYFRDFSRKNTSDIAIIKLQQNFDFSNNPRLGYLKLPLSASDDFVGETAVLSGFGVNEIKVFHDLNINQRVLKGKSDGKSHFLKTEVMSQRDCSKRKEYPVPFSRLCVKLTGRDSGQPRGACDGDSGGPLVINNKVLIGVFSIGAADCDEHTTPGTYTRITSFISFILAVVTNKHESNIQVVFSH